MLQLCHICHVAPHQDADERASDRGADRTLSEVQSAIDALGAHGCVVDLLLDLRPSWHAKLRGAQAPG